MGQVSWGVPLGASEDCAEGSPGATASSSPSSRGDCHTPKPASAAKLVVTRTSQPASRPGPAGEHWELDLGAAGVFTHSPRGLDSQPDPNEPRGCPWPPVRRVLTCSRSSY